MPAIQELQTALYNSFSQVQAVVSDFEGEVGRIREETKRHRGALAARAESEVNRLRAALQQELAGVVKAASDNRDDATRPVGNRLAELLAGLDIASTGDLKKIDRKLARLSKRLRDLEESALRSGDPTLA